MYLSRGIRQGDSETADVFSEVHPTAEVGLRKV